MPRDANTGRKLVANTGAVYPGLGESVSESPWRDNGWSNPTNIYFDDGNTASVTASSFDNGDQTYVLKVTGFDFSGIPAGATIDGVICRINTWYRSGTGAGSLDLCQLLNTSKSKVGTNQCATPVALTTNNATIITKGSSSDTWGNSLTYDWVTNSNFGVALGIKATANNSDVDIDYVTLDIYYTPAAVTEELAGVVSSTTSVDASPGVLRRVKSVVSSTSSFTVGLTVTVGVVIESLAGSIAAISELASLIKRTRKLIVSPISGTIVVDGLNRIMRRYGATVSTSTVIAAITKVMRTIIPESVVVTPVISEPYPKRKRTLYTWRPGMPTPK